MGAQDGSSSAESASDNEDELQAVVSVNDVDPAPAPPAPAEAAKPGPSPRKVSTPRGEGQARRGSVHTIELAGFLEQDKKNGGGDLAFAANPSGERVLGLSGALAMATSSPRSSDGNNAYSYHQRDVERAAQGPQAHPTSAALYSIWRRADTDGNGFLSAPEIKSLNAQLNVNWDFESIWSEIQAMYQGDPDERVVRVVAGEREIGFGAFVQLYNIRMGAQRRKHRLEVKSFFEKMDVDRSGTLDYVEVQKLVKRCKKQLMLLPPEYSVDVRSLAQLFDRFSVAFRSLFACPHLCLWRSFLSDCWCFQDDWREMTLGAEARSAESITFPEFERWWKDRMGLVEADTPVLPEYFSHKLSQLGPAPGHGGPSVPKQPDAIGAAGSKLVDATGKPGGRVRRRRNSLITSRDAHGLWNFLNPRLRLMAAMRKEWGELHDVYGHTESMFGEPPIPKYIRDPESNFSVIWDLLQIVFLLYVSITVPYRACFGIEIPFMSFTWWFDTTVDVYFISDIILNFRTAFVNSKGVRETEPKVIARSYMKGWFPIDFVSCIPVGHISYAIEQAALAELDASEAGENNAQPDNLKALKALRLLKLSKMLRLARLKRIMQKYENLMVVQQYMGIFAMLAIIVFTAHFLTCIWYTIGDEFLAQPLGYYLVDSDGFEEDQGLVEVVGWVFMEPWYKAGTNPLNPDALAVTASTRYVSSMYYVFNALDGNGNTDSERMTAVFAYMMMVMIDGAVAGVMSALLIGMSGNEREVTDKLRGIKQWMTAHRVPRMKQNRALGYFAQHFKVQAQCSESEILEAMPPSMRDDFRTHLYGKFLGSVPIFRDLSQEILAALCAKVEPMIAVKQQVVFEEGSTGNEMYMLMVGELEVTQSGQRLGFLSDGAFFGEVPILDDSTGSEVRTRTITAMTDSKLCFVTSDDIKELRERYPELALRMKRFAKVGRRQKGAGGIKKKGLKLQEATLIKKSLMKTAKSSRDAVASRERSSISPRSATAALAASGGPAATGIPAVRSLELEQEQGLSGLSPQSKFDTSPISRMMELNAGEKSPQGRSSPAPAMATADLAALEERMSMLVRHLPLFSVCVFREFSCSFFARVWDRSRTRWRFCRRK